MPHGAETFSDNGAALLFSTNLIGWFCARSGVSQTGPGGSGGLTFPSIASINCGGCTYPLSAIRMHGDVHFAARYYANWSTGEHQYITTAPVGHSFTWYVYDYAPRLPVLNGGGVETYDDYGTRTFSSGYSPFKPVKDLRDGDLYYPGHEMAIAMPTVAGYSQNSLADVAWWVKQGNNIYIRVEEDMSHTHYNYVRNCRLIGGRVQGPDYTVAGTVPFSTVTGSIQPEPVVFNNWSMTGPVLAVDVTGIAVPGNFF